MSNTANPPESRSKTPEDESSVDDLFDVLAKARRRTVLVALAERPSSVDVETLARVVAAREEDVPQAALSEATVEEVHVTLHHVHLPKLDDADLVDYDRNAGTVATTGTTDAVPIDFE